MNVDVDMDGRRFLLVVGCASLLVVTAATLKADGANFKSLASQARQESDRFQAIDPRTVAEHRQTARLRLAEVEQFLQQGDVESAALGSWREVLQLDKLAKLLDVAEPDPDRLRSLVVGFYRSEEGLEDKPLIELRAALNRYEQSLRIPQSPEKARAEYERRLAAVAELLEPGTGRLDAVAIDGHLEWLAAANQAPEFIRAVRREFAYPNVMLIASRSTLAAQLAGVSQDVDQTQFVSTTILGAEVSGDARFQATVTPEIVSDTPHAEVEIQISGRVTAPNSVAVRRPVILYTSSTSEVTARKRIYWKGLRLEAGPTTVNATTCSQINDVQMLRQSERRLRLPTPGGRLITRLARSQAERQRADAESEASWQTEQRIAEQINELVAEKLTELNSQVEQAFVAPLTRLGALPQIQTRNIGSQVRLDISKPGVGGLSAPHVPSGKPLDGLLTLQIHETAISNFLRPVAAGARWSDRQFAKLQKQLLGDNSYEFRIGLHPRWEVVMDSQRPVAAQIRDQSIRFEFNVRELSLADESYRYPFSVAARYRITPTTTVLRLDRLDDVELTWTGAGAHQPAADHDALDEFLRQTFTGFFLPTAYTDGLETPTGGDWNAMSDLELRQVDLEAGWLRLAFDRAEES